MSHWLDMKADAEDDICHEIDDLIEGYALGSLEIGEFLQVSDTIGRCPDAAERLARYEETVGLLGLAVPAVAPDASLWARLERSTRVQAVPGNVTPMPVRSGGVTVPRWAAALASVAALLLLSTAITLGIALRQEDDEGASAVADATVAEYLMAGGEMTQLASRAAPEWMTWPGRGTLITAPDMPAVVIVDQCAPTEDSDWNYIVWLRIGDVRTMMGEMEIDENGKGILHFEGIESLDSYDAIGISIRKDDTTSYDVMEGSPSQDA